jgi:hypothetical protein
MQNGVRFKIFNSRYQNICKPHPKRSGCWFIPTKQINNINGKNAAEQTDRHDVNEELEDEFLLFRSSKIEPKSEIRGNLLSDNNRFSYQHYMQKKKI